MERCQDKKKRPLADKCFAIKDWAKAQPVCYVPFRRNWDEHGCNNYVVTTQNVHIFKVGCSFSNPPFSSLSQFRLVQPPINCTHWYSIRTTEVTHSPINIGHRKYSSSQIPDVFSERVSTMNDCLSVTYSFGPNIDLLPCYIAIPLFTWLKGTSKN